MFPCCVRMKVEINFRYVKIIVICTYYMQLFSFMFSSSAVDAGQWAREAGQGAGEAGQGAIEAVQGAGEAGQWTGVTDQVTGETDYELRLDSEQ